MPVPDQCPCGSGLDFVHCCGPIIDGAAAQTPLALMRARYTAFSLRRIDDFLRDTLTAEKQAQFDLREVELSARDADGVGFDVRAIEGGGPDDQAGSVEYVARFRIRGQVQAHHELAFFIRQDGRWLYSDAQVNPKSVPRQVDKVGRNDPCPCGSGQKYKKCCGG